MAFLSLPPGTILPAAGGAGRAHCPPRSNGRSRHVVRRCARGRRSGDDSSFDGSESAEAQLRKQMHTASSDSSRLNSELKLIKEHEEIALPDIPPDELRHPNDKMGPEHVVLLHLLSLQRNDYPEVDSGVETAFNFAAPMNRRAVGGTVEKFARFVRRSVYSALLNCMSWEIEQIEPTSEGRRTKVVVNVRDVQGQHRRFLWTLGLQRVWRNGTYANCWLVEGVIVSTGTGNFEID